MSTEMRNPADHRCTTSSSPVIPSQRPRELPDAEHPASQGSIDSTQSSRSHQEYLDSLVVPSKEQIAHIAETQAEREAEQKRAQRHKQRQSIDAVLAPATPPRSQPEQPHHIPLASRFGFNLGHRPSLSDDGLRTRAATVIQRTYRGYRARREIKGLGINASTRWVHAIREAQWRELTTPRPRSARASVGSTSPERPATATRLSAARQNWKKVATIARHAGGDLDADSSSSSSSESDSGSLSGDHAMSDEQKQAERKRREEAKARRKQEAKMMGLQYFLEMVDLKHRYGANLRVYHEEWKRADTNENFFYWLDYGEGKNLDIEACPREVLDREQVRYLSREERQYYLVKIDDEGRLCWAKNGARIDTTEKWKDSIHGIVPSDDPTPAYTPLPGNQTAFLGDTATDTSLSSRPTTSSSSSSSSSNSSIASANANRYACSTPSTSTKKKISHHLSGATIFNKLLRKTVRKNTWIFVADTSFRLYVGIKNSGAFQHSSFLQGSRISAAGLIRIRDGRLTSLSPLSGHYRPPASNFRAFVRSLKEAGVDMGRVSVSKSYAVLVGLEMYVKARKKASDALDRVRKHGHAEKTDKKKKAAEGGEEKEEDRLVPMPGEKVAGMDGERTEKEKEGGRQGDFRHPPDHDAAAGGSQDWHKTQQRQERKEEEKMRKENEIAVEVMQELNLGDGLTEPKGQKGGGDAEEAVATATANGVSSPPSPHISASHS
ncbi:hypothetical protein VTI28DRAFT_8529 [Corynascus sepedonium]